MALTFATTIIHESVFGNKRIVTADVVATGTGTATGDEFLPAALGLRGFDILMIGNSQTLSSTATATTAEDVGYHVAYDYVNEKLIYTQADGDAGAHVASTAQLTNTTVRVMAVGY
jgi:hypothetical protein